MGREDPSFSGWHSVKRTSNGRRNRRIAGTNCVLMKRHGITVLGRNVSECYGRVNILAAEIKRNIIAEQLAAIRGSEVDRISKEEMEVMYRHGDAVMYPQVKK